MMKPGIEFEPVYKMMADYKFHEDECDRMEMTNDA